MDGLKIEGKYFFSLNVVPFEWGPKHLILRDLRFGYVGFWNVKSIGCFVVCGVSDFIQAFGESIIRGLAL